MTGDDWSRLGDDAEAMTTWIGNLVFMRMEEGRCAALEAREGGSFACGLYLRRPEICRELARGSPECDGEIATKSEDLHRHLPVWRPAA